VQRDGCARAVIASRRRDSAYLRVGRGTLRCVSWYLHAVEGKDGRWSCRHGRTVVDTHAERTAAVDHLKALAIELELGTVIFVHTLAGLIERVD